MIKIILILALLQYINNFIFGYKSGQIFCGIFGQASNKPESLDVNAVHILGIYNIERGKMSCGLTWDGDIQYGLGVDKLYTDFIVDRQVKPSKIPIMFGHTRQPSYGMGITIDNAHPFGFGESQDKKSFEMIFCHNGTLKNHKELANKYNIALTDTTSKISSSGVITSETREKIDSEILGEILYKTKTFHVLSEYIGAAALVWTWIDEPNKVYLWSGASKTTQFSTYLPEIEERPLNVYSKNKNNMFFSSLSDSLVVLGADNKEDLQIDYNTVYVVTNGDFKSAKKHKVSRLQSGQSEAVKAYNYGGYASRHNYCDWEDVYDSRSFNSGTKDNLLKKKNIIVKSFSMINLHEDAPLNSIIDYIGKVYSKSLRYWKNGAVINGIYFYVRGHGFKFAGDNHVEADVYLSSLKNKIFNYEEGNFDMLDVLKSGEIIFKENGGPVQFHYFIEGVLLKSFSDYVRAYDLKKNAISPQKYLNHTLMSHISKHPVISMEFQTGTTVALLDGKPFSGNITELGFEKVYYFINGSLNKWTKREDLVVAKKQLVIELPAAKIAKSQNLNILNESIENIKLFEEEFENQKDVLEEYLSDDEFIKELIMQTFQKHAEEILETSIELNDWKDNEIVKEALETLKLITHTLKDFVENPNKK